MDPARIRYLVCGLLTALALLLGACARVPAPALPQVPVPPIPAATRQALDERIGAAVVHARNGAVTYARVAMQEWQGLVRRYAEEAFIPWYTGYWTQQWITIKVAWYQMQHAEGEPTPEARLTAYLQREFFEQVLQPASEHVDPLDVMQESSNDFLRELGRELDHLPPAFDIAPAAFERHLDAIPAIVVATTVPQQASLLDVLNARDLHALPAYQALWRQIAAANDIDPEAPARERMSLVARRAIDKLLGTGAVRTGTAAAAAIAGGPWGVVLSAGGAVWGIAQHELDNSELQAQLRVNLEAALEIMWQGLVEDRGAGVTAPVRHMAMQIEQAVHRPAQTPLPSPDHEPRGLF